MCKSYRRLSRVTNKHLLISIVNVALRCLQRNVVLYSRCFALLRYTTMILLMITLTLILECVSFHLNLRVTVLYNSGTV